MPDYVYNIDTATTSNATITISCDWGGAAQQQSGGGWQNSFIGNNALSGLGQDYLGQLGGQAGLGAMQTQMNSIVYGNYVYQYQYQPNVIWNGTYYFDESAEEKAAREAREAKLNLERTAAELRAEELLLLFLSPEQAKQYRDHSYFETDVDDRTYRIKKGRSGNVELMNAGKAKYRYCAHPEAWTPDQDVMLSQLLMLKTDEERFLKTANRTVLA